MDQELWKENGLIMIACLHPGITGAFLDQGENLSTKAGSSCLTFRCKLISMTKLSCKLWLYLAGASAICDAQQRWLPCN